MQKIPLFGTSLFHQLLIFVAQQHPQFGVLLSSISTSGAENILAKVNLDSTGGDKGL